MVQINFARKAVTCKVVFYGPARAGKTANLQFIHDHSPAKVRGSMTSMATDTQRTLFFDFLPLDLGEVAGIRTKVHLYSVPYIDNQNAVRLLVLEGADGIVFVADRTPERLEANREALENLRENLGHLDRELEDVPLVFQWNKSDHPDAIPVPQLESEFNLIGRPSVTATSRSGQGVMTTLKSISGDVLKEVTRLAFGDRRRVAHGQTRAVEAHLAQAEAPPVPRRVAAVKRAQVEQEAVARSVAAVASIGGVQPGAALAAAAPDADADREPVGVPAWRRAQEADPEEPPATLFFGVEPPKLQHEQDSGGVTLPPPLEEPVGTSARDALPGFSEDDPPTDPEPELHLAPAPTVQPPGWFDEVEGGHAPAQDDAQADAAPHFPLPATSHPEARGKQEAQRWKPPAPVPHAAVRRPTARQRAESPVAAASGGDEGARGDHWAAYHRPPPPSRGKHNPRPVVDRRRRPRAVEEQISDRSFWTGAVLSLVSLIAIGYVVHAFL